MRLRSASRCIAADTAESAEQALVPSNVPLSPQPSLPPPQGLLEALERETERISNSPAIRTALKRLLEFEPRLGMDGFIHRARPSLTLSFRRESGHEAVDRRVSAALKALATLLAHSFRLNTLPSLKLKFWKRVFESEMLSHQQRARFGGLVVVLDDNDNEIFQDDDEFEAGAGTGGAGRPAREPEDVNDWLWMVEDESFPVVSIDMNRGGTAQGKITRKHVDALTRFFTTPPEHALPKQFARPWTPDAIGIELLFGNCELTPRCARHIEALLDRVYASPTRQFTVRVLDLSPRLLELALVEVVAELLEKNRAVYHIEDVRLQDSGLIPPWPETLVKLQALVAAACAASVVRPGLSPAELPPSAHRLKRLDVNAMHQCLAHVAAVCSALRYGCQLECVRLDHLFARVEAADRKQCWRWLAFGIFHPRSRTLAASNRFRRLEMHGAPLHLDDVVAFAKTLDDPARELVHRGRSSQEPPRDELLLCTVQRGAKFYARRSVTDTVLYELDTERQLEALCERPGWVCAVLPGIGFGWVKRALVRSVEHEPIDRARHSAELSVEWAFTNMQFTASDHVAYPRFLQRVGRYVTYLDIARATHPDGVFLAILDHCPRLQHLSLRGTAVADRAVAGLVAALGGRFGDHLRSLDLSQVEVTRAHVDTLADALAHRARAPALQELRLATYSLGAEGFATLRQALEMNRTLRFVELQKPYTAAYYNSDEQFRDAVDASRGFAQSEALPSKLSVRQKLAFLSALQHSSAAGAALQHLDSFMVAAIFKFAAERVHRRLLWARPLDIYDMNPFGVLPFTLFW